jgi:hypothetical protein
VDYCNTSFDEGLEGHHGKIVDLNQIDPGISSPFRREVISERKPNPMSLSEKLGNNVPTDETCTTSN